jgi:HEAT repeat protein
VGVLAIAALALSACSVAMLAVLVVRRWYVASREVRRRTMEDRLKGVALELLHEGVTPPAELTVEEKGALADLLGRYARAVRGETRDRIVDYFSREGTIDRELSVLAEARLSWRRATAAFRLGDIANESAASALIAALGDRDRDVRIAAVRSLGRLRVTDAGGPLVAAAAEQRAPDALVRWALLQIGAPLLPELRSLLTSPEERERAAALGLIALLGGPADARDAEERLRDSSALVRAQAARALGRLGSDRNLPGLLGALEDRIPAVRAAAAISLGYLRDPRALGGLGEHVRRDQFDVARECARAMVRVDQGAAAEQAIATGSVQLREAVDLAAVP